KIALDVVLLAQSEVAEVAESASGGRSSSMAHKRNPARAVEARAAYAGAVAQAGLLLGSLAGEHERAAGSWQAEWTAVSEVFRLAGGAVARATESLAGLRVDTARMRTNMALGEGGVGGPGPARAIVDRVLQSYENRAGREEER
ncbi:MAG: hypothetical protein ACREPI_03330, partial [Candidatus Dormibacterales bacterium]